MILGGQLTLYPECKISQKNLCHFGSKTLRVNLRIPYNNLEYLFEYPKYRQNLRENLKIIKKSKSPIIKTSFLRERTRMYRGHFQDFLQFGENA